MSAFRTSERGPARRAAPWEAAPCSVRGRKHLPVALSLALPASSHAAEAHAAARSQQREDRMVAAIARWINRRLAARCG